MADNNNIKNLEELKEKASSKFTKEEIDSFINSGKTLAARPVLAGLLEVIKEGPGKGFDSEICANLSEQIERLTPKNHGHVQCDFAETNYKLNVQLSIVPLGYKAEVDLPDIKYARDLIRQYEFLKGIALAYWRQFAEENDELFKKICSYRSDVDFSELVIDPANVTTMYFDPDCKIRIGIFPYYVRPDGTLIRKQIKDKKCNKL